MVGDGLQGELSRRLLWESVSAGEIGWVRCGSETPDGVCCRRTEHQPAYGIALLPHFVRRSVKGFHSQATAVSDVSSVVTSSSGGSGGLHLGQDLLLEVLERNYGLTCLILIPFAEVAP